jgi:site-specific recombinase XerD
MPGQPKVGPVKDHESRIVPVGDDLVHLLREYLMRRTDRQAVSGFLFPTMSPQPNGSGMVQKHTIEGCFREARDRLRLPKVTFYQASRHTFASHYVMDGGSIERLSKILGHCSVVVTERYSHLRADHFTAHDLRPMLGLAARPQAVRRVRAVRR